MTTTTVTFTVHGEPVGKERPRAARMGGLVRLYTPAKTRDYEQAIAQAADVAATAQGYEHPERGWYELTVDVYRTHERRGPDLDNIGKAVADACNGILWRDDSEVRQVLVRLAGWGVAPCVVVHVRAYPYVKTKRAKARVAA